MKKSKGLGLWAVVVFLCVWWLSLWPRSRGAVGPLVRQSSRSQTLLLVAWSPLHLLWASCVSGRRPAEVWGSDTARAAEIFPPFRASSQSQTGERALAGKWSSSSGTINADRSARRCCWLRVWGGCVLQSSTITLTGKFKVTLLNGFMASCFFFMYLYSQKPKLYSKRLSFHIHTLCLYHGSVWTQINGLIPWYLGYMSLQGTSEIGLPSWLSKNIVIWDIYTDYYIHIAQLPFTSQKYTKKYWY